MQFTYESAAVRVLFGAGSSARVGEEVARLGAIRVMLIATVRGAAVADDIVARAGVPVVSRYARAAMHVPRETVDEAVTLARADHVDLLLAIGGGSSVGLAKAVALETDLRSLVVPTTYAGSEMTSIYGITEAGEKRTGRDERVRPRVVVYDPALTLDLPATIAGPSGINAMAHAVEALYAHDGNPVTSLHAEEAIRALGAALPRVVASPADLDARTEALYGAWLASLCLASVSLGLHHKLCHVLGGTFALPHAETHAVVLPYAVEHNAPAAPEAMLRVVRALQVAHTARSEGAVSFGSAPSAAHALAAVARAVGAPRSLQELGLRESDLDRAAALATEVPYPNPRPVTRDDVRTLLGRAYRGDPIG